MEDNKKPTIKTARLNYNRNCIKEYIIKLKNLLLRFNKSSIEIITHTILKLAIIHTAWYNKIKNKG